MNIKKNLSILVLFNIVALCYSKDFSLFLSESILYSQQLSNKNVQATTEVAGKYKRLDISVEIPYYFCFLETNKEIYDFYIKSINTKCGYIFFDKSFFKQKISCNFQIPINCSIRNEIFQLEDKQEQKLISVNYEITYQLDPLVFNWETGITYDFNSEKEESEVIDLFYIPLNSSCAFVVNEEISFICFLNTQFNTKNLVTNFITGIDFEKNKFHFLPYMVISNSNMQTLMSLGAKISYEF